MKKLLCMLLVTVLLFSLAACGGAPEEEPTPAEPVETDEKANEAVEEAVEDVTELSGTLVVRTTFYKEVEEQEAIINEVIKPFEEQYGVEVKFEVTGGTSELLDKVKTEQEAGKPNTDVIIAHYSDMVNYIEPGWVLDLNEFASSESMQGVEFISAFDSSTSKDGVRYFFPVNADVYLTIVNKEAFEFLPEGKTEDDFKTGNYTWEDYIAWAGEISANTDAKTPVFMKGKPVNQLIYQIGGMSLSNGGTFPSLDSSNEGTVKTWEDLYALRDLIHSDSAAEVTSTAMMEDGRTYLAFDHMGAITQAYEVAPAKYEVIPGPRGTTGQAGSIAGGHGIGIMADAPNMDLAKAFTAYFTSSNIAAKSSVTTGSIAPNVSAVGTLGNEPADIVAKRGLDTLDNAIVEGLQMIPDYTDWGAVKTVFDNMYAAIFADSFTVEDIPAELDAQQAELDGLLVQ